MDHITLQNAMAVLKLPLTLAAEIGPASNKEKKCTSKMNLSLNR